MSKLEKFKSFQVETVELQKLIGGAQQSCQYYENKCMQTAYNNGNTFLLDDCDALCDANGNWNQE
jgi:hypothetical protein